MNQPKHNSKTGQFDRQLDYKLIKKLRGEGKSYSEISHIVNCSSTAVAYILKKSKKRKVKLNKS